MGKWSWAWVTSRWLLEVEQVRPVHADWRLMSLAHLNLIQRKGERLSQEYRDLMEKSWGAVRVCAAAADRAGRGILGPLYTAIGTRCHNQSRRDDPTVITEALAEVNLPDSLAAAASSEEFDQLIRDSHEEAFNEVGFDVGTPVLRIGGTVFFGPVIRQAPRGEEAGRLWDGLVMVAETKGFFELKRSRDRSVKPSFE
ncbi:disulfide bond formation protein DsbA [Nonomuraea sp. KC401]|nr:disulfide bond formation protein DsbA [Nonomuraea sp. K271]TLF60426.1 disulfide bond formation protein DsbA [Nonomuraea sp. KC401]